MKNWLRVNPTIQEALQKRQPIVALESTIITHGMPFPTNMQMAREVEEIVWEEGAIPATVAVIKGEVVVGAAMSELERLANSREAIKVSRRDLPYVVAQGKDGGTTVAATMAIAAMVGIRVFATGGIGGVHRGVETTLDISADLFELSRSDVVVVCAGAKAILDLPRTLEYLETLGVPVIGFGTDQFPAFYTRESGLSVPIRLDTYEEIARLMHTKWSMGLKGGLVVANPIPEKDALPQDLVEEGITRALDEAAEKGVKGKEVTPFLLDRMYHITGGQSLTANLALVKNNARAAARLAKTYAQLAR